MCSYDCLNCVYADCKCDTETEESVKESKELDYEIRLSRAYTPRMRSMFRYNHSEKGMAARERYRKSEKGIATTKRYLKSEKGREMLHEKEKRRLQKDIESGKNAERCRRYYQRKKAREAKEALV